MNAVLVVLHLSVCLSVCLFGLVRKAFNSFVSYGVICLPLSLLSRSSVRVKSRTHDPVQVLDEAKDSITSIHLSKHEILIGYVYNNSLIVSFQLVHVEDPMDRKLRYDIRFDNCTLIPLDVCAAHTLTC